MTRISVDDFLLFSDRTIDGFIAATSRLDDYSVNRSPFEGASSAAALTIHALSAATFWCDHVIAGNPTSRDRASEFVATATVAELVQICVDTKASLRTLGPAIDATTTLHIEPTVQIALREPWTVGAALIHAYEELAQHLGHVEMTVDVLINA